jgi:hypothetical protein
MKTKLLGGLVIVIILIVAGSILIFNQSTTYDKTKEKDLGIGNYLSYLEECKSVKGVDRANLSERLRVCPPIPEQEVFDKLSIIEDLKGIKECDNSENVKCDKMISECEEITNINFKSSATSGGHTPTYTSIRIYECGGGKYYLSKSSSPPPRIKISRIQLTESEISELE